MLQKWNTLTLRKNKKLNRVSSSVFLFSKYEEIRNFINQSWFAFTIIGSIGIGRLF